jgi:GTP 3',8-cyclase
MLLMKGKLIICYLYSITMNQNFLSDQFGRKHDYLRISLTDACNLRCVYCMPDEKSMGTPSPRMMQRNEILEIAKVFVGLGIKKIRLTGGEPLVRKDAREIILQLSQLPADLSISTNGVLIDAYLDTLSEAKISSVNFSLDTLNGEEFFTITKRGDFDRILKNIYLTASRKINVKINMVVMKGVNEHAILDFVRWTKEFSVEIRFIEFMPFKGNDWSLEKVFSYREMMEKISHEFHLEKIDDEPNDTAKKYRASGHKGTVGFITTITEPFCAGCNRLRLTADGKMKNCLFSQNETDLLSALRKGDDIRELIISNLQAKKKALGGRFDFNSDSQSKIENRSMIRIGG